MQSQQEQIDYCRVLTTSTRETYNRIKKVYCPILDTHVVFNAKGFHHLLYKPDGTSRNVHERIYKLTLFPLAVPVVKNALAVTGERNVTVRISRKKNVPTVKKGKTYTLIAKVGRKNPVEVRIIVLRIGTGNYKFWSIMKN